MSSSSACSSALTRPLYEERELIEPLARYGFG
jgi:hypothetical protein